MSAGSAKTEQLLTSALITLLRHSGMVAPEPCEVHAKAKILAKAFEYRGNLDVIVKRARFAITTRMGAGHSLLEPRANHDEDWAHKRPNIEWVYTEAYMKYLGDREWSEGMRQSLRDVSLKMLGLLQDPTSGGSWDRRGLVIGNVQSGKTANYLALIARAADAGYKFIVVIAGIHNILRSQTQQRIDEGFVGRNSETKQPVGVGLGEGFAGAVTLTTVTADFDTRTAKRSGLKLNQLNKPLILVIKKNVNTLTSLYHWLKDMNTQGASRIEAAPMLMIDDEADHASINTNKPDVDPTKTNRLLRQILKLFGKSSFVGYTATPFANIFINPEAYDEEVLKDLFPRHFIYCLEAPTSYFGPDKVFLDDIHSDKIVVPITDCEDILPIKHQRDHDLLQLPGSLCRAVNEFVVARAIRNLRGHEAQHCSMMINVSRFVAVQASVQVLVSSYVWKLKNAVQANYKMPDQVSSRNAEMKGLRKAYDDAYPDCDFSWKEVKAALQRAATGIRLFLINSRSDDALDYKKYERDSVGLTAIAVGGLSLSRGLTIEGLCVSYIYRNTRMYDTLMQMGRWFGYRVDYEDLCRIHLSADAISWYSHVAEAARELVAQVREMRHLKRSPKDFGLYVKAHPDQLLVTSPQKMRSGEEITLRYNYSGRMQEFAVLPLDTSIHTANEKLIVASWGSQVLEPATKPSKRGSKGWVARDVPVELVEHFLCEFRTHEDQEYRKMGVIKYLREKSDMYRMCDVVLVSLPRNEQPTQPLRQGVQRRSVGGQSETYIRDGKWVLRGYRVGSRGDEGLGLSDEQVKAARMLAQQRSKTGEPIDFDYRSVRKRPLVMVHVVAGPIGSSLENHRIPTIGVSFPPDDFQTEVEVVANLTWIQREFPGAVSVEEDDGGPEDD